MNTKCYQVGAEYYCFNFEALRDCIDSYSKSNKISKKETMERISQHIHISDETVINWKKGRNAPNDLSIVESLADFFKTDTKIFLRVKENAKMVKYTDLQIMSVKRIYDMILDYLCHYEDTEGFYPDYSPFGVDGYQNNFYSEFYMFIHNKLVDFGRELRKEYLYLHDTQVYDELYNYINTYLFDMHEKNMNELMALEDSDRDFRSSEEYTRRYVEALNALDEIITKI